MIYLSRDEDEDEDEGECKSDIDDDFADLEYEADP